MLSYSPRDPCRNKRLTPDLVPRLAWVIRRQSSQRLSRFFVARIVRPQAARAGQQHDRNVPLAMRRRLTTIGADNVSSERSAPRDGRVAQASRSVTASESSASRLRAATTTRDHLRAGSYRARRDQAGGRNDGTNDVAVRAASRPRDRLSRVGQLGTADHPGPARPLISRQRTSGPERFVRAGRCH